MAKYRWFRLVLNSNGGDVTLRNARLVTSARALGEKPAAIRGADMFPAIYPLVNWNESTGIETGKVLNVDATTFTFKERYAGMHLDFGGTFSLDSYKDLSVEYLGGTCQNSEVYFGTNSHGKANLGNNSVQNAFVTKVLPLSEIINTQVTAGNGYSASRLTLQALRTNETCVIRTIKLQ
jgi:hypothetical protein